MGRVPVSLEVLRQEARDELGAIIDYRCRQGEDPQEFLPDLPTVDEMVVLLLRTETIESHDLMAARARAYHPAAARSEAETFEYQLLCQIALDRPGLTRTVWLMLGRMNRAAA